MGNFFHTQGFLAMRADSVGMEVPLSSGITVRVEGTVAVVSVRGPLYHHPTAIIPQGMAADYDSLKAVVAGICQSEVPSIMLSMDSPGGDASGCFDTAREIRTMCDAAGKKLYVYVDGTTASAAYALACVADHVAIPAGGVAGSVGVFMAVRDTSEAAGKAGLKIHLVGSGSAKGAASAGVPVSEEALAEISENVNRMADVFFALVAEFRGVSVETIRSWEGRSFVGQAAVDVGLADSVASEDQLLAMVAGSVITASADGATMEKDDLVKALRALAETGDEQAQKALAAFDGEPDGDEKEAPEAKAEGDEEPEHKEPDGDEPKALAALTARIDSMERSQLMASRPDLSPAQVGALKGVPTLALRAALSAIPRAVAPVVAQLNATLETGTQGKVEGSKPADVDPVALAIMDRAFGLSADAKIGSKFDGITHTFGVPVK